VVSFNAMQVDLQTMLPVEDENGVDLTLIRWMLSLTPAERIASLQDHIELAMLAEESLRARDANARTDENR
jgi:hypothetical protein